MSVMHPLLLALNLFVAQPSELTQITLTAPVTPQHYIEHVGYIDTSIVPLPNTDLVWPTTAQRITRGMEPGHPGMDIDGNDHDPVYAAYAGTVSEITYSGSYGTKIELAHPTHPEQIATLYAHLSSVSVNLDDTVTAGQLIGATGRTGNVVGSHLHVEVHKAGLQVDPLPYFQQ